MESYYEKLAKTIRTALYPNGVKIDEMARGARYADKVDARRRRVLKKKMQEGEGRP